MCVCVCVVCVCVCVCVWCVCVCVCVCVFDGCVVGSVCLMLCLCGCTVVSFNPGCGNGLPSRNSPRDPSSPLADKGVGAHAFNHLCRTHVQAMPCRGAEPNLGLLGPGALGSLALSGAPRRKHCQQHLHLHPNKPSAALVAARGGA